MKKKIMKGVFSTLLASSLIVGNIGYFPEVVFAKEIEYVDVVNGEEFDATYDMYFMLTKPGVVKFFSMAGNPVNRSVYKMLDDGSRGDRLNTGDKIRLSAGKYKIESSWGDSDVASIVFEEAPYEEIEFNDLFDFATNIECNTTYRGDYTSHFSDVDYYHFTLSQPGLVQIVDTKENKEDNDYYDNKISIFFEDSDANVSEVCNESEVNNRLRLPAGSYFIKMSGHNYAIDSYTLRVNYTPEPTEEYEKEYNDSKDTANLITTNTTYTGNISTSKDTDYFKFSLTEKTKITLKTQITRQADTTFNVAVYNSVTDKKLLSVETTSNPVSTSKEKELPAGEYYVKVSGDNDIEDYSFTLVSSQETIKKPETEPETTPSVSDDNVSDAIEEVEEPDMAEELFLFSELEDGDIIRVGDVFNLYGEVLPDELNEDLELEWKTSNKKIATVSKDGKVTCKGVGNVKISATTTDGSNLTASMTVTVKRALSKVNTLSKITYTQGKLTPGFSKTKKTYTLTMAPNMSKTVLKFSKTDAKSDIEINGKNISQYTVKLKPGASKKLRIAVTAENGSVRIYTVTVKRKK